MSVVAVASVRSCGVTTLTTGLAMVWPGQRRRLVVEADPAGATLAAAAGLACEPGLVSLAAAARRDDDPLVALEHAQPLPGGGAALCGPPSAERARSALMMLSRLLGRLRELDAAVFVDCGRIEPSASNATYLEHADLGVLAVRPRLADLHALASFLQNNTELPQPSALVLIGSGPYPGAEVADALGVHVAGQIPWDPDAAQALASTSVDSRQLTRTPLVRALRTLAVDLANGIEPVSVEAPAASSAAENGHASAIETAP
jgi:MinD-like ATPase involved in chromosome partitioning or flagellar assembly